MPTTKTWVIHNVSPYMYALTRPFYAVVRLVFYLFNSVFLSRSQLTPIANDLLLKSASELAELLRERKISSVQLVEAYIKRIEEVNHQLNAVVVKNYDEARKYAQQADQLLVMATQNGKSPIFEKKPFLGVPFTLKDTISVEGLVCTAGTHSRRDIYADKDAATVARMKAAGAIPLAVTNVSEVGMWWESHNTVYGRSKNAYDTRRTVGGSSGGEGSLISAAGSVWGIGADIGGSIRMPAFFNGIFGLKPSPNLVPDEGSVPEPEGFQVFMHTIGPLCRYAEDLKPMLKVLAGPELQQQKVNLDAPVDLRQIRFFYMEGLQTAACVDLQPDMRRALTDTVEFFENEYSQTAHRLSLRYANNIMLIFLNAIDDPEAESFSDKVMNNQGELKVMKELCKFPFGKSNHTLPALILALMQNSEPFDDELGQELTMQKDHLVREVTELLGDNGILLFPSFPSVAQFHNEPLLTPFNFVYTGMWNVLGLPVVQCPTGLNEDGLPTGVQIVGAPKSERILIEAARVIEKRFGGWRAPA